MATVAEVNPFTRFGEGFRGTFAQNQARRDQQAKDAELERAKSMAIDAVSLLDKLNRNDLTAFNKVATGNIATQMEQRTDFTEMVELAELAQTDPEAAKQELRAFLREAQIREILPRDNSMIQEILGIKPKIDQQQVNVLRKTITGFSKDFRQVEAAFNRIKKVGRKATGASDLSLIFNFMKINDPGSTVREGEFATAQQTTGVPGRIVSLYNRLLEGTRLTQEQRDDFLNTAEGLVEGQRTATDNQIENILQQADEDQIARSRVFGKERLADFEARRAEQPATPDVSNISIEELRGMSDEELEALLGR